MHPLSATLAAAIKRADRLPTLTAVVTDQPCEVPRWSWTAIYGPTGDDGDHALVQLFSGPLVRARRGPLGQVYVQKIADPAVAAQWSAWTELKPAGTSFSTAGIALGSATAEDRLRLFWVLQADGRTIKCAESTDGVAWAEETVVVEASPGFAVGLAAGGDDHVVYGYDAGSGSVDQFLISYRKAGGVWTNRAVMTVARHPINGIGAAKDAATGIVHVVAADAEGVNGAERRLSVAELDANTNTWGAGYTLVKHGAASGYDFRRPRLRLASAAFPRHVFTWVESWAGDAGSPAYERPMLCVTPRLAWLTEWLPWDVPSPHGFELLRAQSGTWYLAYANRAYSSPGYTAASGQRLDVSADVVDLRLDQPRPMAPAGATLLLDESAGRYATAGLSGAALCLRQGAQLSLRLGFRTSAGDEGVWEAPLWVDAVAHRYDGRQRFLELAAVDAWGQLERLRPALTVQFPAAVAIGTLLDRVLWRVTGVSTTGPAGLAATLTNAVWQPGRSYAEIARGLCALVPTRLRFRTLQSAPDGAGLTSVTTEALAAGGAAIYAFGAADHPLTAYRLERGARRINHVALEGARTGPYRAESHDFPSIKLLWRRLTRPLSDLRLASLPDAQRAADASLAESAHAEATGWLDAPLNPAQEVGDPITVLGTPYTVSGRHLRWSRLPRREASMRLLLENAG
jgi:hypothetical protein